MFGQKLVVGIDIGKYEIKAAVVGRSRGQTKVVRVSRLPLTRQEQREREWEIERRLREFVAENRLARATFVACVPMSVCTVKLLKFPPAPKDTLQKMVRLEAEAQLSLSLADVEVDFQTVRADGTGTEVLMGACKKSFLRSYLGLLERAGCRAKWVVISALGDWCWLSGVSGRVGSPEAIVPSAVALVNIGAVSTDMVIGQGKDVYVARSITVGADDLSKALEETSNISPSDAEWRKREQGVTGNSTAVDEWLRRISDEISRTVQVYQRDRAYAAPVERVVLTGGGAMLKGLTQELSSRLRLPVELCPPVNGSVLLPSDFDGGDLMFTSSALGAALTVAQNRPTPNLLPAEVSTAATHLRLQRALPLLLTGALLVAIALTVFFQMRIRTLDARNDDLHQQLMRNRAMIQKVGGIENVPAKIESMQRLLDRLHDPRGDWLEFLYHLSRRLPSSIWLNELSCIKGRKVTLQGSALSRSDVADAVNVLQRLKVETPNGSTRLFADIETNYANTREEEGQTIVDFQLTCLLKEREKEKR